MGISRRLLLQNLLWFVFLVSLTFVSTLLALIGDPAQSGFTILGRHWKGKEGQDPIAILMTGDIMLGRYIATLRDRNGGDFPFTYMPEVIEAMKAQLDTDELDLIAGNLEGPITEEQVAWGELVFWFKPEVADLLAKMGFTTLNLANNHSFNQTRAGHTKTVERLAKVGIDAFGHPDTVNGEWSFIRYDFEDISVGFLGLNDADFSLDQDETIARIQELDPQVDFLIVSIHWGFEYETTARESIVDKAHAFVDAGADFIWGHHPHVVQNSEVYNGAPIYYSLGNFVFDQYWSKATQEGLALGLKLENGELITAELMVDLVNLGEPKPRE